MFSKARRKREIITTLIEEGLGYVVHELKLSTIKILPRHLSLKLKKEINRSFAESITETLQRLGGLFIKGGQFLSTRPDLIPYQFTTYLSTLQDKDTPIEYSEIKRIVEKNLSKNLDEVFRRFDKTPVSSASIGQVHFAILKNGSKVAVKVRRPNIKKVLQIDLVLLRWIVRKINKYNPELAKYNLKGAIEELSRWSKLETNYTYEAKNMNKFHELSLNSKYTLIPEAKMNLTTEEVLVMDWMAGCKVTNLNRKAGSYKIAKRLTNTIIEQYVKYGIFHGDPHPGNIFVSDDNKIIFLDFGIIGHLSDKHRTNIINLLSALIHSDCETLTKELIKLNIDKKKVTYGKLYDLNQEIINKYNKKIISFSEVFYYTIINAVNNNIKLPTDYILLAKSVVTVAKIISKLAPHFSINQEFERILRENSAGYFPLTEYITKAVKLGDEIAAVIGAPKKSRRAAGKLVGDVLDIVSGFFDKK